MKSPIYVRILCLCMYNYFVDGQILYVVISFHNRSSNRFVSNKIKLLIKLTRNKTARNGLLHYFLMKHRKTEIACKITIRTREKKRDFLLRFVLFAFKDV